jgi:6-phosphofructokinase 2
MKSIATLTLNPTIDTAFEADDVRHTQKTRTFNERVDPGGGGINVARVLKRFDAKVIALFLAGGHTGKLLDELLCREGVPRSHIEIEGDTRLSVSVYERSTGHEYRFVPEGPVVADCEWQTCLDRLEGLDCEFFVASGSLPRGVPEDFYAQVRRILPDATRFVLDTSGPEFREALKGSELFLVKPSRSELEAYAEKSLTDLDSIIAEASKIVAAGQAKHVAVTLGADGAMLVNEHCAEFVRAPTVNSKSAVGAGDSFLAGMIFGLVSGQDPSTALRLGVAAGAATSLTPGTDLCHPVDVEHLFSEVQRAA